MNASLHLPHPACRCIRTLSTEVTWAATHDRTRDIELLTEQQMLYELSENCPGLVTLTMLVERRCVHMQHSLLS